MQCPFRYRAPKHRWSLGVAQEFVHYILEKEERYEEQFNKNYPTCWDKFMNWMGIR